MRARLLGEVVRGGKQEPLQRAALRVGAEARRRHRVLHGHREVRRAVSLGVTPRLSIAICANGRRRGRPSPDGEALGEDDLQLRERRRPVVVGGGGAAASPRRRSMPWPRRRRPRSPRSPRAGRGRPPHRLALEPALEQMRRGDRVLRRAPGRLLREGRREALVVGLDRDVELRASASTNASVSCACAPRSPRERQRQSDDDELGSLCSRRARRAARAPRRSRRARRRPPGARAYRSRRRRRPRSAPSRSRARARASST